MEPLKVLLASPEVVPFSKTGGLADVCGMLPRVLAQAGHTVRVISPRYGNISEELLEEAELATVTDYATGDRRDILAIYRLVDKNLPLEYLFVSNNEYFDRPELYRDPETGLDYTDNDDRFRFFCRAVLEGLKRLEWAPDIIHANDWQTALLPTYLATLYADDPFFRNTRTLLTIHNLAYQGTFPEETFARLDLPVELFCPTGPFEFWGKVNFMKSGIWFADLISTVSERYAAEIQSSGELGCGLEGVLRSRNSDLFGILNGVDYDEWSPVKDSLIPYRFNPANLSGKKKCKVELAERLGLPYREQIPLIGMITRLADQKGLDLIAAAADDLFAMDLQMVILGTGETRYHALLTELETQYPDKLKVLLTYDNTLAHWIEAGSDIYLMPSRYEPCGLNQMYSLAYGAVPVVRATGGLADTIVDVGEAAGTGTGFVFQEYDPESLLEAVARALAAFGRKRPWRAIMKEGMRQDFSWTRSARKYAELYQKALTKHSIRS